MRERERERMREGAKKAFTMETPQTKLWFAFTTTSNQNQTVIRKFEKVLG